MIPRIDFFSYTVENYAPHFEGYKFLEGLSREVWFELAHFINYTDKVDGFDVTALPPNRPYRYAMQERQTKLRFEWGNVDTVFVQMPGTTCEWLREHGSLDDVIFKYQQRATRIDFAADMLCDTTPREFVAARTHKKFRSVWDIEEVTGDTVYVGSWSSDRFARVYRYHPPHERSAWLRAEHVFKGKRARRAALAYIGKGIEDVTRACGETWGWGHHTWQPVCDSDTVSDLLKLWTPERKVSKTLKWLETQVAPALAKVMNSGEIVDVDAWLIENVYWRLNNRDDGASAAANNVEDKHQWQSELSTS